MIEERDSIPPAAAAVGDPDASATERPAHCRSPLWDHRARIEKMLEARYSYQQIANALCVRGVRLSGSEVGKWCRRQGMRSVVSSRHQRPAADKKSAPAAAVPTPAPAQKIPASPLPSADAAASALSSLFKRPIR